MDMQYMCFISTNKQQIFYNIHANKQLVNSKNWSLYLSVTITSGIIIHNHHFPEIVFKECFREQILVILPSRS